MTQQLSDLERVTTDPKFVHHYRGYDKKTGFTNYPIKGSRDYHPQFDPDMFLEKYSLF